MLDRPTRQRWTQKHPSESALLLALIWSTANMVLTYAVGGTKAAAAGVTGTMALWLAIKSRYEDGKGAL